MRCERVCPFGSRDSGLWLLSPSLLDLALLVKFPRLQLGTIFRPLSQPVQGAFSCLGLNAAEKRR